MILLSHWWKVQKISNPRFKATFSLAIIINNYKNNFSLDEDGDEETYIAGDDDYRNDIYTDDYTGYTEDYSADFASKLLSFSAKPKL